MTQRASRNPHGMGRVTGLLLLPLGVVFGLVMAHRLPLFNGPPGHFVRQGGYRLTQPLLDYELAQQVERTVPRLRHHVKQLVDEKLRSKTTSHVSVYFRDLTNGPSFGIHEKEPFIPASLLKVPVLMAYLKQAETNPQLLAQQLAYTGSWRPAYHTPPSQVIEVGKPYSVEELLFRMIVYSDNLAMAVLYDALDMQTFTRTFLDLGVAPPTPNQTNYEVSVKRYAAFFRILFNASYLNPEMSEKALDWLTKAELTRGLPAGVPPGVLVAHKFGERAFVNPSVEHTRAKQFHDCGIVYCPRAPYLLCVMTRGDNFEELIGTIREVSRLVYEGVCR